MTYADQSLRREFVDYLNLNGAWPTKEEFTLWVARSGGARNEVYGRLREGQLVNPRFVVAFVEMLRERAKKYPELAEGRAFREFLREVGIEDPQHHSPAYIAQRVMTPEDKDYLLHDAESYLDLLRMKIDPNCVRACKGEKEVRKACRWLFIALGRECEGSRADLPADEAIAVAEQVIRVSLKNYQDKAIRWWRFDPWTIVMTRHQRTTVGMTVVLPLKAACYARMREGRRMNHEVEPEDMERPARLIQIDGIAACPAEELDGEAVNISMYSTWSLLTQIAVLSPRGGGRSTEPRKVIAHAGTPTNRRRMISNGYVYMNTTLPDTRLDVYERTLDRWGIDYVLEKFFDWYARDMRLSPPSE